MTTPPLPLLNRELGLIEFNRRVLRGQLSEGFGEATLDTEHRADAYCVRIRLPFRCER